MENPSHKHAFLLTYFFKVTFYHSLGENSSLYPGEFICKNDVIL